jgi:polyhydroxybutyrate depolymerase
MPNRSTRCAAWAVIAVLATTALAADEASVGNFHWADRERTYFFYEPAGRDPKVRLPLVVLLHGAGGTGRAAFDAYHFQAAADREQMFVVAPDGVPARPAFPANALTNPRLWNDGSGRGAIGRLNVDDVGFLRALVDELVRRHSIDEQRVYCTGFSNGAGMAFRLAAEAADRFAAVAPLASHCWIQAPQPSRPIATLYLIGDADPLNPLAGGAVKMPWGGVQTKPPIRESLERWAGALHCGTEPQVEIQPSGLRVERFPPERGDVEFVAYFVPRLGHTWPGGKRTLPEAIVGAYKSELDATSMICDFFRRHCLSK